ncbi:FecR family protein [Lewinella sp. IMCC34191]|uniref:FecR family protein n=1 Tax=Lewinella sp. IMCC34191 TaxID=2259172 RepID=UPI00130031DA|nr:FecR domain-containing protein [Lewinella sp. IMCC34191]
MVTVYREDYAPDVEAGLRQLHARITPVRQLETRRTGVYRYIGAAAAAVVLLVAGLFVFGGEQTVVLSNQDQPLAEYTLPDGSQVTLQRGSSLSYHPESFNQHDRALDLTGQGYFKVSHDATRPFLVSNGGNEVRVTGTAFNLRTDSGLMEVEVSEGSVLVNTAGKSVPVQAMEYVTIASGEEVIHEKAPNLNHHAWRTGLLKFDHTPISEVLTYFSDNWGIVCQWKDNKSCDYSVSGSFQSENVADVLRDIAKLGGLSVRSTGDDDKHFQLSGQCNQ